LEVANERNFKRFDARHPHTRTDVHPLMPIARFASLLWALCVATYASIRAPVILTRHHGAPLHGYPLTRNFARSAP
jgi:hypothetical protein